MITVETTYERGQYERAKSLRGRLNDRLFCGAPPRTLSLHSMIVWTTTDEEARDNLYRVELNFHLLWPSLNRDHATETLHAANLDEIP